MQCLEKDPAKRPQSMNALLQQLALPATLTAEPVEAPKLEGQSRRGLLAGLFVALALLVGGAAWVLRPAPVVVVTPPPPPPPVVVPEAVDAGEPAPATEEDAGVAVAEAETPDAGAEPDDEPDAGAPAMATTKPQRPVSFDREMQLLADATRRSREKFRACIKRYPALLGDKPEGKIAITFELRKSGELGDVSIKDAAIKDPLKSCLERVMKGIKLPPHTGEVRKLSYPMTYKTETP
jgi:hypothetical protein